VAWALLDDGMATPNRRPFDHPEPSVATPTDAAPRRVAPATTRTGEGESATGGAARLDVTTDPTPAELEGHQSSTSFGIAVGLAVLGVVLLFVNSALGAAALGLSVAALLWAAYGLGTEAWRAERQTRRHPHPDAPDGMPE
jgi:hypothetical protein